MGLYNGIELATGLPVAGPQTPEELTKLARADAERQNPRVEQFKKHVAAQDANHLGPAEGVNPDKLNSAGWGVIFHMRERETLRKALAPLLEMREREAGGTYENGGFYREFEYLDGQTVQDFLASVNVAADGFGPVEPKNGVPYYLLIAASPADISFEFQYLLDVQYAVGRIHFDSPAEYTQYAHSVVAAESADFSVPKRVAFLGTNTDDLTEQSAELLIDPLALFSGGSEPDRWTGKGWTVEKPAPAEVTKAAMTAACKNAPSLWMVACHGSGVSKLGSADQLRLGGSLQLQPATPEEAILDRVFAGEHVPDDANLLGSILFLFACYGAGLPQFDEFPGTKEVIDADGNPASVLENPVQITEQPFVSSLPKRLLGHKKGALAVVGHVERAWTNSFQGQDTGSAQLQTFKSTWIRLMEGRRVGYAMEHFNIRYAEITTRMQGALTTDLRNGKPGVSVALNGLWTSLYDARNYVVIGDPAVRLRLSDRPKRQETDLPEVATMAVAPRPVATTVDKAQTVEISTFLASEAGDFQTGGELRARTTLERDGKMVNVLRAVDGKLDEALLRFHMDAVEKAMAKWPKGGSAQG